MISDVRDTPLYNELVGYARAALQPGSGEIVDAIDLHCSAKHRCAVFSGVQVSVPEYESFSRICSVDLASNDLNILSDGPNNDRAPKFSPDGATIAFLSDRHRKGDFQLYLFDWVTKRTTSAPAVDGWIEYLHWSIDGREILLGVAAHGADIAGVQGAVASKSQMASGPSWLPTIDPANGTGGDRSFWVFEVESGTVRRESQSPFNVWEAVWCGKEAVLAVTSEGPDEDTWYSAKLTQFNRVSGTTETIFSSVNQIGLPAATPSGRAFAVVECVASDRLSIAGTLWIFEDGGKDARCVDTDGVNASYIEWCSETKLLITGHKGLETVVGYYDCPLNSFEISWSSCELSSRGARSSPFASAADFNEGESALLIAEGFLRPSELAQIKAGSYHAVRTFGSSELTRRFDAKTEKVEWQAPDGLCIQGYLLRPDETGPHPLIMHVHGGPCSCWRPHYLLRNRMHIVSLLNHGFAIFLPNPRGSGGRGLDFAGVVFGDVGGADAQDLLAGVEHLVNAGIADERRLGVTGISYGGFMTSWLVTQDKRFAAAVSVAAHNNHVTAHLLSNIPSFVRRSMKDTFTNVTGNYYQRSPIMFAKNVSTPVLHICGMLDKSAPPAETAQFHRALLENGSESIMVSYPEEGHGIRSGNMPAYFDYSARVVEWFQRFMPSEAV